MYAAKTFGVNTAVRPQSFLGRHELRFLIDHDLSRDVNIEVAESFNLTWALGCICGVRPGAMAQDPLRPNDFLRFKDLTITRHHQFNDRFIVEVNFRCLKGYRDDSGSKGGFLALTIMPPQQSNNISLNPGYRLLIMLLRRGWLQDYKSVDSLLTDTKLHIRIAPAHLEKPVFAKTTARGSELEYNSATSVPSLSAYLARRVEECGFPGQPRMMAWRSKQATEVTRALGPDVARGFLHHRPKSSTLEKYYLDKYSDIDCARIAFGEDFKAETEDMRLRTSAVLWRAELLMTRHQQKDNIDAYVERFRTEEHRTKPQLQRLRQQGKKQLLAYARRMFEEKFTREELLQRQKALSDRSQLAQIIHDHAENRLQDVQDVQDVQHGAGSLYTLLEEEEEQLDDSDEEEEDGYDAGDEYGVLFGDEEGPQESDEGSSNVAAGGNAETGSEHIGATQVETDAPTDDITENEVFYSTSVREFFIYMLEGKKAGESLICPHCYNDETIPEADRSKVHPSKSKLTRHLEGTTHTKYQTFTRKLRMDMQNDPEKKARCPADGCPVESDWRWDVVMDHLQRTLDGPQANEEHLAWAREVGFFDPDWKQSTVTRNSRARVIRDRYRETSSAYRKGKRPMIESLPKERAAVFKTTTEMPASAVVGPPSERQSKWQRQLIAMPGVVGGNQQQPEFHELYGSGWPVDVSATVKFGSDASGGKIDDAGKDLKDAMEKGGFDGGWVHWGSTGDRAAQKF